MIDFCSINDITKKKTVEYTLFSNACGTFTKTDDIQSHKAFKQTLKHTNCTADVLSISTLTCKDPALSFSQKEKNETEKQ